MEEPTESLPETAVFFKKCRKAPRWWLQTTAFSRAFSSGTATLKVFFQISAGRLKYVNDFLKFILYGSVKRPQVYRPSGRLFEVIRRGGATKYKTSIACWKRCCDMISQRSPVYGVSSTWSMRFLYGNLCRETD